MVMMRRLFIISMKKEPIYVKCNSCSWQLENYPDRNWEVNPCPHCKNTRLVIDPKEILCNLCGECMCPLGTMNEQCPHGLHEAQVTGGYDSYHLLDMNVYTFSICEECLRKLFMVAKIPPQVHDVQERAREDYTFEDDQKAYEYREWKSLGGFHQAYLNKKCNAETLCPKKALYTVMLNDEFTEDSCCEEHKDKWTLCINADLVPFISNVLKPFL